MADVNTRFNLQKASETLDRFLLAKGLRTAPTMRVGLFSDVSMSMNGVIARGDLQKGVNQLVPVALKFDDDGNLDMFKFDTRCEYVGTISAADYEGSVRRLGIEARGGTSYAPIIRAALDFYFKGVEPGKKAGMFSKAGPAAGEPALGLIITDGECNDRAETERMLVEAARFNIYFHFVAVGSASFSTIKYLADKLPNVGDVYLRDFGMDEEEVYNQIVCDELVQWIQTV